MNQLTARRFLTSLPLLWLLPFSLQAQQSYWQQQVDFDLSISLNDAAHTLEGSETITYRNNSPDTLRFIWLHLWPNAYKNDRTAFSEQMVGRLSNTAFYFSKPAEKGYINKLAFKVNGQPVVLQDSSDDNIDMAKLFLPQPLAPGANIQITTPFHVQLPKNFSRGGHIDQSYQITQWYPKPAVYDAQGWHPMPYLDQGEFYNEFGNYKVSITVPQNYVVAATGELTDESEKQFLLSRNQPLIVKPTAPVKKDLFKKQPTSNEKTIPPSARQTKTLHYTAENVVDFAWFADKRFFVQHDTVSLAGKTINAYTFILPQKQTLWKNSIQYTKRALHFYAQQLGAYPYPTVSVVCAPLETAGGGMEYPMATLINVPGNNEKELDLTIAHEIGHNWLQALLATNERDHPWMDEGMNTYYERKYSRSFYPPETSKRKDFKGRPLSTDPGEVLLTYAIDTKTDQPIETSSADFTRNNYIAVAYTKAALWMEKLEGEIGGEKMQQLMQAYFSKWAMKHPQPADFRQVADSIGGAAADSLFPLLNQTGPLPEPQTDLSPPSAKLYFLYPTFNSKIKTFTILPALGANAYDKLQLGILLHNYGVPVQSFHFAVAPLYATGSKQFNFIGHASYTLYGKRKFQSIIPAVTVARLSTDDGLDENYTNIYKGFFKIVPSLKLVFRKSSPTSTVSKWLQWKSYFISEGVFDYKQRRLPQDTFTYYAVKGTSVTTNIHQLSFGVENNRSLYPYRAVAQLQKAGDLVRATITGNYFFNYGNRHGVNIRFFGGKIFYTQTATDKVRFNNDRYFFNMYGNVNSRYGVQNGTEDYTYSNPFIDRNQNTNLWGRQIVIRDGGFKYRTDFSDFTPGRTDNWLAALNFSFDVPRKINPLAVLPIDIPLKVFADMGTYAEAWQENNSNRFLYSIGLQLPLLRYINVYAVVLQSKAFSGPNDVNGTKWWQKRLTFSVDVQNIRPKISGVDLW
jgi:hypothetical protein